MIKFDISIVRFGRVGDENEYLSVTGIAVDEGETEIIFPESFEGKPITHIGYGEKFCEAEERFHDWHHPGQGTEYVPAHYEREYVTFRIPQSVTRIFIPKTVKDVCYCAFKGVDVKRVVEIDPENTRVKIREDGTVQ